MKFRLDSAELFIPDGAPIPGALERTTHMAVAGHQDDLEIMAASGILECFQRGDKWFAGVVVTNGSGSPRDNIYKNYTDEQMRLVRRKEQKKAAVVGEYSALALLDYASGSIKNPADKGPVEDLVELLRAARPEVVYTHNLADKHDTHVGVAVKLIEAVRRIPAGERPRKLYGCEVWRDLDWMTDADKVPFNVSGHENLQAALLGVFDSQIAGGKRYDLATMGRRKANATYFTAYGTDETTGLILAMDLTPLVEDEKLDPAEFVLGFIERFRNEVAEKIRKLTAS
ncbi:MAG: PIG-L family deacetylase [Candidatus Hydrogenedentes bacterium]|nr:PIG-L family deacetylase [Candidatus Hydrogenedentota bacterium]